MKRVFVTWDVSRFPFREDSMAGVQSLLTRVGNVKRYLVKALGLSIVKMRCIAAAEMNGLYSALVPIQKQRGVIDG